MNNARYDEIYQQVKENDGLHLPYIDLLNNFFITNGDQPYHFNPKISNKHAFCLAYPMLKMYFTTAKHAFGSWVLDDNFKYYVQCLVLLFVTILNGKRYSFNSTTDYIFLLYPYMDIVTTHKLSPSAFVGHGAINMRDRDGADPRHKSFHPATWVFYHTMATLEK